jgi:hypothetical protein
MPCYSWGARGDSISQSNNHGMAMPQNDTPDFYEVRFDIREVENVPTGRNGTREAILSAGNKVGEFIGGGPVVSQRAAQRLTHGASARSGSSLPTATIGADGRRTMSGSR